MAWPRSFIDRVRRDTDAVGLIGEVVSLKRRGARWVGLCPFHQEKTPSFSVSDEGLWYCFGCGEGGDVFRFVMQHEGVEFVEAVRALAERAGIALPDTGAAPRSPDRAVARERLLAAVAAAARWYAEQLRADEGRAARAYLQRRGLSPATVEAFGLGWAPAGWDRLLGALRRRGFDQRELVEAGLVKRRADGSGAYDLLRGRIVFPIRDQRGRPIAFGGRVLEEGEPKYLNSPETRLFVKRSTLYGLAEARQPMRDAGFVLLVEGYLDLLACVEHGFRNVVAPLGTAFTEEHARLLSAHVDKAVVAFDGDESGRAAAERTVGVFLAAGFQVSVLELGDGEDPDSLLRAEGAAALRARLQRAMPALSFLVGRAAGRGDLRTPQGKARALEGLLGFVVRVRDRVERAEWVGRIAETLRIDEHLVAQGLAEMQRRGGRAAGRAPAPSGGGVAARLERVPLAERDLLRAVLRRPAWWPRLRELCGGGSLRDARVAELLAGVERLLEAGHEGPVRAEQLIAVCDMPEAQRLLSRLVAAAWDDRELQWDYVRGCALGIRRDALRRELQAVQRQIEEALARGDEDVAALQRRKLELAREIKRA